MIEYWPPDARLHTDGRVYRWVMHISPECGIACHRSRSLLIATLSLWRWVLKARADKLPPAYTLVLVSDRDPRDAVRDG